MEIIHFEKCIGVEFLLECIYSLNLPILGNPLNHFRSNFNHELSSSDLIALTYTLNTVNSGSFKIPCRDSCALCTNRLKREKRGDTPSFICPFCEIIARNMYQQRIFKTLIVKIIHFKHYVSFFIISTKTVSRYLSFSKKVKIATKSNFLILLFLQPDGVNLRYYFNLVFLSNRINIVTTLGCKNIGIRKSEFVTNT